MSLGIPCQIRQSAVLPVYRQEPQTRERTPSSTSIRSDSTSLDKEGDCVPLPPIVAEAVHKRASVLVHADDQGFARGYPMLPVLFKIGIRSAISAPLLKR